MKQGKQLCCKKSKLYLYNYIKKEKYAAIFKSLDKNYYNYKMKWYF